MRYPVHIRAQRGDIAPRVIASGDPGRVRLIATTMLSGARLVSDSRGLLVYTGEYKGVPVTVATHGIGASSASVIFEELIALGARAIIRLGTCGSLRKEVGLGDFVIPTTASYYPGGPYYQYYGELACGPSAPTFSVLKLLIEESYKRGSRYHVGPVVSSDAFYVESSDFVRKWSERGALAVEMECSALFVLSSMRGIKSGAILIAVDSPIDYSRLTPDELVARVREGAEIALESLLKVEV